MKKTVTLLISALTLIGVLAGCGNSGKNDGENGAGQAGPEGTLSEIIDEIYENKDPGLMVATMDVTISDSNSLKSYTGLDSADKISEACVSETMIGAQAYSLVLARVKDSADAEDVANAMKSGIDRRKWICVEADDLRVAACGDVVMLIMVSSQLSDAVTAAEIVEAFKTVCGGSLTVEL